MMLTTCLGPNDLLVLAIRRGHSEVEVPVIRDHTRCSLTTGPWGLTTGAPTQLQLLVHGAARVRRELLLNLSTMLLFKEFRVLYGEQSNSQPDLHDVLR